jgi:hypothetical protein
MTMRKITKKKAQQFYKGIPEQQLEIENLEHMVHVKVYKTNRITGRSWYSVSYSAPRAI